jgi:hypothetical protein
MLAVIREGVVMARTRTMHRVAMTWPRIFLTLSLVTGLLGFVPHQASTAQAHPDWVPSWVRLETGEMHNGQRYVLNRMVWTDTSGLATGHSTYEQDFAVLLDASSPGTYFDRAQDDLGMPNVVSWKSNLPDPYLDTRYGDDPAWWVYTIGSADAGAIETGKVYFTLIVTEPGDAMTDVASLSAQIGEFSYTGPTGVPVPCGILLSKTWCSWGIASYAFAPDWSIEVPGAVEFDLAEVAAGSSSASDSRA